MKVSVDRQKDSKSFRFWSTCEIIGPGQVLTVYNPYKDCSTPRKAGEKTFEEQAENIFNLFFNFLRDKNHVPKPPIPVPSPAVDEDENNPPPPSVRTPDITDLIKLEGKHKQIRKILKFLRRRRSVVLWGNPGSGKTHLIMSIAKDMNLKFCLITLTADSMRSEIRGSVSPINGEYFPTEFRHCWENGGVVLFDEIGLALGNLVSMLNSALAQGIIDFPDGKSIERHQNCFIVFADNSNLRGNDPNFPERQDLGSAFRDRLSYERLEYDLELELRIIEEILQGNRSLARKIQNAVLICRRVLQDAQVPLFASPRFSFKAAEDMFDGFTWTECLEQNLYQGIEPDIISIVADRLERAFV